jgi:hypothetical protein
LRAGRLRLEVAVGRRRYGDAGDAANGCTLLLGERQCALARPGSGASTQGAIARTVIPRYPDQPLDTTIAVEVDIYARAVEGPASLDPGVLLSLSSAGLETAPGLTSVYSVCDSTCFPASSRMIEMPT